MKKFVKNFISIVLVFGMVLSFITVPAMADDGTYTKNEKLKIGFDSLTADEVIGGKPNQFVNGGKENSMWSGFYMEDEISKNDDTFYLYDGANYDKGASSKIILREPEENCKHILVDYARDRVILRLEPGKLYTFKNIDDSLSIDRIFLGSDIQSVEAEMDYVND